MVETRKGILSKAKLALRPMTILASLSGVKGLRYTPRFAGPPLTPLQLAVPEVCSIYMNKVLDNADDVIHGT